MLALQVSLALIVLGGTASVLVLRLTSAHKALPPQTLPSKVGPTETGASETGPSETGPSGTAASGAGASGAGASGAARAQGDCITVPHACGFPDGTDTGVASGTALRSVPAQVSSGPGWHFDAQHGDVVVTGSGTVLSDLFIPHTVEIDASDVTVRNVRVVTGGYFGISLRNTTGVTIEDSTISGRNLTSGRVGSAIDDVHGDSTGIVIKDNNISRFKTGVQISTGLIVGNYIHDPGYIHGDHTNGIFVYGTTEPLTIYGNTVLINLGQTDAISLDASRSWQYVANKTIKNNFLAGGSYTIYGGGARNARTSNIVIEDNEFGRLYYPKSGRYGPVTYFDLGQAGNVWSQNVWSGTGAAAVAG